MDKIWVAQRGRGVVGVQQVEPQLAHNVSLCRGKVGGGVKAVAQKLEGNALRRTHALVAKHRSHMAADRVRGKNILIFQRTCKRVFVR